MSRRWLGKLCLRDGRCYGCCQEMGGDSGFRIGSPTCRGAHRGKIFALLNAGVIMACRDFCIIPLPTKAIT